jgi:transcriptional regulator with XRE-family HTH domain
MELRQLREGAGLTTEQVAELLYCSHSKISRIETGKVGATPRDVRDMLEIYGVTGEQQDALITAAMKARQEAGQKDWRAYGDARAVAYIDLETAASTIRQYEALVVPGLLQTRAYAAAILEAVGSPGLSTQQRQQELERRIARQSLLIQDDPPTLRVVLDEAVLHRPVGGPTTMREQLQYLREAAQRTNVSLQILPFAAGVHAGMAGSFTVLNFSDSVDPGIVFLEHSTRDFHTSSAEEIAKYTALFEHLSEVALSPDDSVAFLPGVEEAMR